MKNLASANWLEIVAYGLVLLCAWGFFRGMSRTSLKTLAKLSIGTNLAHILLSLTFRKVLLPPSDSPAFPPLAAMMFWIEFGMAGFISAKILNNVCSAKPGGETDIENISVIHSSTITGMPPRSAWRSISRNDWLWTLATDACFIASFSILMSFRHLTYRP